MARSWKSKKASSSRQSFFSPRAEKFPKQIVMYDVHGAREGIEDFEHMWPHASHEKKLAIRRSITLLFNKMDATLQKKVGPLHPETKHKQVEVRKLYEHFMNTHPLE